MTITGPLRWSGIVARWGADAERTNPQRPRLDQTNRSFIKCSYCSLGVDQVLGSQVHFEYDVDQLNAFIDKQLPGREIYVTFYDGEPTHRLAALHWTKAIA